MFSDVPNSVDFIQQERAVLKFWEEHRCFDKLRELRKGAARWSFIDGPITANNPMGVHHAWGRTYKDIYHRLKAMQGYQMRYQNGFDCQGLWVEVNVERDLGFETKRDIEAYGMEQFVNTCKRRVLQYAAIQTEQSIRLGYWMDWNDPDMLRMLEAKMDENPAEVITLQGPEGPVTDTVEQIVGRLGLPELGGSYFTFSTENNYTIWLMLKKCFENGWVYKGTDVMPWCSRCGTGISQHEIVTDGYRELTHRSLFLLFPLRERPGESLLVWTTTPWTLTSNVGAVVHPELNYVLVEQGDRRFWLSRGAIPNALRGEYRELEERKGSELAGWSYDGPFDELPVPQQTGAVEAHRVILWDEVSEDEGTGIVHTAPGCGAEDFALSKGYDLPVIAPLDEIGVYQEGFDWLTGRQVHTVAEDIFENLKQKGLLYRLQDYTHRYPVCWRCSDELVFRLVDEWYISMGGQLDKPYEEVTEEEKQQHLRYQMMEVVRDGTKWYPDFGFARELDWLRNMHDWMISKKRFWGLALPIYECKECGHFHVVGSREELRELAVEGWETFEGHTPHRPWIDAVKIACPRCGATVSRIPDVGNPWLDAGIVSCSTLQYRTNRDHWKRWFPADLISESFPGQFRNWFYSLIAMGTVLERKAPFKNVFTYATLYAEDGREMHKSWGNTIWFDDAAEKMGVDVMRWMYCVAHPEQNLSFGHKRADEVRRQFLIPFWNVYSFFVTYANLDGWQPEPGLWAQDLEQVRQNAEHVLDRWILAKLQTTVQDVTRWLERFEPDNACRDAELFLDDLSNWYVRRSRRRFWKSEADLDKASAYRTLYTVLTTYARLLAPIIPFVTEQIYQNLVRSVEPDAPESVHHTTWPKAAVTTEDAALVQQMATVRSLVTQAHAARAAAHMKVRQPLARVLVAMEDAPELDDELTALMLDELNVKVLEFVEDASQLVSYQLLPEYRTLGPKLGKRMPLVRKALDTLPESEIAEFVRQIESGESIVLQLEDGPAVLGGEEIQIRTEQPEGFAVVTEQNVTVAVDTELTPELIGEGLAREVVRRIQNLRKDADFSLEDRIVTTYQADEVLADVIAEWNGVIAGETLSVSLQPGTPEEGNFQATAQIEGHSFKLSVRKVK